MDYLLRTEISPARAKTVDQLFLVFISTQFAWSKSKKDRKTCFYYHYSRGF